MTIPLLFVALGSLATILSVFFCALVFGAFRRQSLSLWEREQRLPEATKYDFLEQRVAELQHEYDQLRDAVYEAKQTIEERDRVQQRLDDLQSELQNRDAEFAELQALRHELESLQVHYADLNQKRLDLENAVRDTELIRKDLERTLSTLQERVENAQVALADHLETITLQKQQCEELHKAIAVLQRKKEELQRESESLDREAQKKLDNYNRTLDAVRRERGEMDGALRREQERYTGLKADNDDLDRALARKRGEHAELESRLPLLREDWQQMLTRVGHTADEEKTRELWQPVFFAGNYHTQRGVCEEDNLATLQSYLEGLGLRFSARVLCAFHTALKVNDVSPLVVLAGISGTGKSELPRRYAEAMGIHFLNIAVQPRWDSPQDMFGFFNYLEGRYRATELGRALVQMDRFHGEAGRGWDPPEGWDTHSLKEHVLLVLLDEMNLARIEYYFSEFLSRLEMRRGIDMSSRSDRRKAEIPLEVGRASEDGSSMQLFVGRNVLFVGTMNEDETTQSLSDKVVDRANVLRFGSPPNLIVRPHGSDDGNGKPRKQSCLAYDAWQSWLRSPESLDEDVVSKAQLHQWIGSLNQALEKIGRPFAYRVSRAIEAYVANYPRFDEARDDEVRLKWAVADQIEQKILPKFRGLDPSDGDMRTALSLLKTVINELDDQPLLEAIDKANREHQFRWQGVQRDVAEYT